MTATDPDMVERERWAPIAERLTDIAGVLAQEAEAATAIVRRVADDAHEIAALAARLQQAADAIEASVRQHVGELAAARRSFVTHRPTVDALAQSVDSVAEISAAIASIARQSQVLGLNARIEASRQTSDSRGFAAVAHEMSTLANQTKSATDDIADRAVVIVRHVQAARVIVASHGDLVATQDELLSAAHEGAVEQRDTAATLASITAATAGSVGEAATVMGRIGTSAVAVKLLARRIARLAA